MRRRVTYRPSKANGIFGIIWGGIFVLIGLFVVIPTFDLFGILWTAGAAAITGINAYQTFGKHYTGPEINIEEEQPGPVGNSQTSAAQDPKSRLEQLERLKTAGLISDREYQQKRQEILREL